MFLKIHTRIFVFIFIAVDILFYNEISILFNPNGIGLRNDEWNIAKQHFSSDHENSYGEKSPASSLSRWCILDRDNRDSCDSYRSTCDK